MTWQVALAVFYIAVVGQALWQRTYSNTTKLPETWPPALSYLLAAWPVGIIIGLILPHHVHWSLWLVFLLLVEGLFIGIFEWLSFRAIKVQSVARYETILQTYELVTIALAWILLDEKLTIFQVVGGLIIGAAALLAIRAPTDTATSKLKLRLNPPTVLAFGSALALAIGLVAEKAALRHMDNGAYYIFGFATQALAITAIAAKDVSRKSLKLITPRELKSSFILGILTVSMGLSYLIALRGSNNLSLIAALSAFGLPLMVLASYFILKEKENLKYLLGAAALGCLGLLITTLH